MEMNQIVQAVSVVLKDVLLVRIAINLPIHVHHVKLPFHKLKVVHAVLLEELVLRIKQRVRVPHVVLV